MNSLHSIDEHDEVVLALRRLFKPPCAVAVCGPSAGLNLASLPAIEALAIKNAVPGRQREFIAGRTAARKALTSLGLTSVVIPVGPDRAPQWPKGIVGSIAHSQGCAIAVAARTSDIAAVGVDIELSGAVQKNIWSQVLRAREQESAMQYEPPDRPSIATIFFCAKEAFFKFQYPTTGTWIDFEEVEVTIRSETREFFVTPLDPSITQMLSSNDSFCGRFEFAHCFTIAGLCLPA